MAAALGATLAALLAGRWLIEIGPSRAMWGIDFARWLGPPWRVVPWTLALAITALAALPAVRVRIERAARGLARFPTLLHALAALTTAAVCLALPDRILFTGDSVLRRSAAAGVADFDRLFPQAMALDRFFHATLPVAIEHGLGVSVEMVARVRGALEAALLAALAVSFARALRARGLVALAVATTALASGALGLFTGYDKAFAELAVVTLAFAVAGLDEIERGRPSAWTGAWLAAAIGLHRSGFALLPAWLALVVWVRSPRPHLKPSTWPWARIVPAILVVALAPLAWKAARLFDARHFAPSGPARALADALTPDRIVEIGNRLVFLVPLVGLLPLLVMASWPSRRDRDLRWLAILMLACVLPSLAIHPVQGEFRDWDAFAAVGVALSITLAAGMARSLPTAPAWLALAITAGAAVPCLQWLALQASPAPALARIESWAESRPTRENPSAAATLEFVAMNHYRDGRLADARRAMSHAVARTPSARLVLEWAMAESLRGDWPAAQALFERAIALAPRDPATWIVVAESASEHGDRAWLERAARALEAIDPANPRLAEMKAALAR